MDYILDKLKAGRNNHRDVTLPGTDEKIRIRPLTAQDILDASIEADKIFKGAGVDVTFQNIKTYETEKDIQCLYRACSDIAGNPIAKNISEFRAGLPVGVMDFLINEYKQLDDECNPSLDTMTDAEFDTLVESVKKNPTMISNVSNITTLRRLAEFLAKQSTK